MADVVVAGAGPAGVALAGACARHGLHTVLLDPAPSRPWTATYGLWRDELPGLPETAIASASPSVLAVARSARTLQREYLVADTAGLRAWLTADGVEHVRGEAVHVVHGPGGSTVTLADGRRLAAGVVADATGARRVLGGAPGRTRSAQAAYGLVLPRARAAGLLSAPAVLMDWRGADRPDPTFAYVVPLAGDRVLVEETSLARSPALTMAALAARLHARLAAAGVPADGTAERVRIPLDLSLPRPGRVVPFGVAAAMVHPATGYSLATSLTLAPRVAAAVAADLPRGPATAARSARREIWTPRALAVHRLRRYGLRAMEAMPPSALIDFFELFFGLPPEAQRAFTSGREDLAGTSAAMSALFRQAPWRLRARLLGG
ncbi:lycopene cyclase [Amycolatopsis antarctica]|uniref:Lycopene cyclase n=1 Tax=Amycolatopsis antarctica TaxID=1854586 RepID=A0A263D214_9PSEU|nr:lycopene cyclase family protein [Amycolatopsis antarctica]OZM72500.1 lycopene cyclase [Amycolatopsis antarctica]